MNFRQRFFNTRVLLLLLIVGFVFLYLQLKAGRFTEQDYQTYTHYRLVPQQECDLIKTGCMSAGEDLSVLLQFQSQPSALKPFIAVVSIKSLQSSQPSEVSLSFVMQGMDMGEQSFPLEYKPASATWEGEVILPICTSGRSDWQVISEITLGDTIYSTVHDFSLN